MQTHANPLLRHFSLPSMLSQRGASAARSLWCPHLLLPLLLLLLFLGAAVAQQTQVAIVSVRVNGEWREEDGWRKGEMIAEFPCFGTTLILLLPHDESDSLSLLSSFIPVAFLFVPKSICGKEREEGRMMRRSC